ncbi:MAG: PHP domain-containing protein [Oscillospiraceae bacterium]
MKPFVADVHMHSILSGHAFGTIRELAAEASRRGLSLIGVTEHAPRHSRDS